MKQILQILLTSTFTVLLLATAACESEPVTPTASPQVIEIVPSPTTPPVASPTIVIPEVTKTAPPTTIAPTATAVPEQASDVVTIPMTIFASYSPAQVDTVPAMFHEPIAPDMSNVLVPFALSADQSARLGRDGVVVSPGVEKEFFTVYEKARYDNVPIFVTSDSLLHSYHLIFDKVLRTAERQAFVPLLSELNEAMLAQADAQYQTLQGSAWEDAARRAVAFIGVGVTLLDPEVTVPDYAQELVQAELALVEAAAGIQPSPLFPGLEYGEDYTQYIPRGHYTLSEELEAYFRSMMWYGRMTFRLKTRDPEIGRAETRAALLLVHALRQTEVNGRPALDVWRDLYDPTAFLVGRSDDLTAFHYLEVINGVYGQTPTLQDMTDESLLATFIEEAERLPPPRILGLVISEFDDVVETTKGFRFMGQRFVPDAYIFRQLIWRNVGTRENPRQLPRGLDVMAAMGSDRAYAILTGLGEVEYANYPEQMAKMRDWTASLTPEEWTETLYNGWLYTLQPLLEPPGEGYPQFMQSDAWLDKQLNTTLGSWTELKHDTILYAKQAYAEMGGGGHYPPRPRIAQGYVEPVPEFYARLSALAMMTHEGLQSRNLLGEKDANSLLRIVRLADAFQAMAEKELRGEPLSQDETQLIRFYGGELEHLVMASGDTPDEDPSAQPFMDEEPQAAVIADVATAPDYIRDGVPDPTVLEEGVGRIDEIYAVVPAVADDGSVFLQVAKGGVFSHYEFRWPAEDRLTDEKWRQMLDEGDAPERPPWIDSFFTTETEFADIQRAIYAFQKTVPCAYWGGLEQEWLDICYRVFDVQPSFAGWTPEVTAAFQDELAALEAAGQYAGRQWLNANYRSFDLQSPDLAVVAVRETWLDTLYEQLKEEPEDDDPVLGHRGPYALDVTYTLARGPDGWSVTRMVLADGPPDWQEAD
ncbi:MAG TPA: DUF3160 domain-containing protein [Anaerolineae bacterium]|nr:DUF3160 domain-containing protein [Anaerolineae bacterium]